MDIKEGKEKFVQTWGTLGTQWGISRTMAQIHALLLISKQALCTEEIMQGLQISRGSANMNIRALIDWGLIYKELRQGERREYFVAEKDMWEVIRKIIIQRKRRELEPVLKVLDEITEVEGICDQSKEFCKVVRDLKMFSCKADSALESLTRADANWFVGTFLKMIK